MKKLVFSYIDISTSINLNDYSYDEWIEFVFNHPVAKNSDDSWYWQKAWEWNADIEHIIKYCIQLFRNPNFLLGRYSSKQINQGFWYLLDFELMTTWIWNQKIDWKLREDCILSMSDIFKKMFSQNPIKDICYMWWDLLRNFSDNQDPKVIDTMFAVLSQILEINSIDCKISAIHGLGHLNHKGKKEVIEKFLRNNPHLDEETKRYAIAAIEGKVL